MTAPVKSKAQIKSDFKNLNDVLKESRDRRKGLNGIDKKSVTIHKAADGGGGEDATGAIGQLPGTPSPEQLALINQFTKTPKTAEDLYVMHTLSCNTLPDRDDDFFDSETIQGFQELEAPFSSVGKSFMMNHDYKSFPVGRIFSVGSEDQAGTQFLTNDVYVPRIAENDTYIKNVDFGVNWAVSVGVLLEAQLCSICKSNQYGGWFGGVCEQGHWKGEMYDPKEDRTDDWGDVIPARADDPNAVKCLGIMHGAKDFYELSSVFLGAQFFAEIDAGKGFSKSLKGAKVPVIGLSAKEAASIKMQHTDPKVSEALQRYTVDRSKGTYSWADDQGLAWYYEPGEEVVCLGKSATDNHEEGGTDGSEGTPDGQEPGQQPEASGSGEGRPDDGVEEPEHGGPGIGSGDGASVGEDDHPEAQLGSGGDLNNAPDESGADDGVSPDSEGQPTKGAGMSKSAVLAALKGVNASPVLLSAVDNATDENALSVVLSAAVGEIARKGSEAEALKSRAGLGDQYLKTVRANALAAYVKAVGIGEQRQVSTKNFEKTLDALGDDIETILGLTHDYNQQASGKMPGVIRSSFPVDPNQSKSAEDLPHAVPGVSNVKARTTITRIHG